MKTKQKEENKAKSLNELKTEVQKREKEIILLRMDIQAAKVKNTSLLRVKKDELAVLKTFLREKFLAQKVTSREDEK